MVICSENNSLVMHISENLWKLEKVRTSNRYKSSVFHPSALFSPVVFLDFSALTLAKTLLLEARGSFLELFRNTKRIYPWGLFLPSIPWREVNIFLFFSENDMETECSTNPFNGAQKPDFSALQKIISSFDPAKLAALRRNGQMLVVNETKLPTSNYLFFRDQTAFFHSNWANSCTWFSRLFRWMFSTI